MRDIGRPGPLSLPSALSLVPRRRCRRHQRPLLWSTPALFGAAAPLRCPASTSSMCPHGRFGFPRPYTAHQGTIASVGLGRRRGSAAPAPLATPSSISSCSCSSTSHAHAATDLTSDSACRRCSPGSRASCRASSSTTVASSSSCSSTPSRCTAPVDSGGPRN